MRVATSRLDGITKAVPDRGLKAQLGLRSDVWRRANGMSDLEQVLVRESLIRALQVEHAQFALIVLSGAVSGMAVSIEEIGGVIRVVSGVPPAAEDADVNFPAQAEAFVDELMSLEASGNVGVEWAAGKALAFVGIRCATCGYWEPEVAARCTHCRRNPSHLLAMAREALATAEPDDATLLRELEGGAGEILRAGLPTGDHDDIVVMHAGLGSSESRTLFGAIEAREELVTASVLNRHSRWFGIITSGYPDDWEELEEEEQALADSFLHRFDAR